MALLDVLRVVVGLAILAYASVRDLRERRVPNRTWLVGGAAGAILLLIDLAWLGRVEWPYLLLVPLIMVLTYAFWYLHLIAGGADAKALMMLALLVPYPLELGLARFPLWPSVLPPAATTFTNSLLVFLAFPFAFFAYNAARGDFRFPSMLLGYRMNLERAAQSFVWITERMDGGGRTRHILMSSRLAPEEENENLARLREAGRERVWVTPKIPFMVPLLGGFVAMVLLGDVFTKLLSATILRGRI